MKFTRYSPRKKRNGTTRKKKEISFGDLTGKEEEIQLS
jgi:hypothetical protein